VRSEDECQITELHGERSNKTVFTDPQAQALEEIYTFQEPADVQEFLTKHPFLLALLRAAPDRIRRWFPSSPLSLRVITDAEDAGQTELVLFIATDQNPAAAFTQLQQLDDDWWLDAMNQAQGKFHINLEFR
jgi:hypothetical protein